MKKATLLVGAVAGLFLLAGCQGQSAKEQFIDTYKNQADTKKYNASEFDFKFDDIKIKTDEGSAQAAMIATQLKDISISGDFLTDSKGEDFEFNMNIKAFDQTLPIEMIQADDELYLSGSTYTGAMDLISAFGIPVEVDKAKKDELKSKYIPLTESMLEESGLDEQADVSADDKKLIKELSDGKLNDLFKDYVDAKLKEDDFKKDGDEISHTFTKEELEGFVKYVKENGSKTLKSYVEDNFTFLDEVDKFTLKTTVNTKTDKTKATMHMKQEEVELKFTISLTPKESKEKVKKPNKLDIISEEEASQLFEEAMGSGYGYNDSYDEDDYDLDDSADNYDLGDYKLSDDEFKEIYDELAKGKDLLTKEDVEEYLDIVESMLTDEQAQQIRDLVK